LGRTQYCFGAVVFTLKATGCEFEFVKNSERFTTCVRGRGKPSCALGLISTDMFVVLFGERSTATDTLELQGP